MRYVGGPTGMMAMADDPGAEDDSAAVFSPLHPVFADAPDSVHTPPPAAAPAASSHSAVQTRRQTAAAFK